MGNIEIYSTYKKPEEYSARMIVLSTLKCGDKQKDIVAVYRKTTEERAGLISVIKALKALKKSSSVTLYTDSKFIVDAVNKKALDKWIEKKKSVRNYDLWKIIADLIWQHKVEFVWAKPTTKEILNLKTNADDLSDDCDVLIDKTYEKSN